MRRHAAAGEFLCDLHRIFDQNFRNFFAAANFSFEIAPKSLLIEDVQPCDDPQRSSQTTLSVGTLRRVRLRAIRIGFRTKIFENFSRRRKLLRSRSSKVPKIAAKVVPPDGLQPCRAPLRSFSTFACVDTLRRVNFCAICIGSLTKIFEIFSRPQIFRSRSRQNPCLLRTCSLATTLRGPHRLR